MSFTEITGPEYTQELSIRVFGPELTWVRQFRTLLGSRLTPSTRLLDVGCSTGYAYCSFKSYAVKYHGIDVEREYLDIARKHFGDDPYAEFHELNAVEVVPPQADIVMCSAVVEHVPSLMPVLAHLAEAAEHALVLRSYMGETELLQAVPSPVAEFRGHHVKHMNQYAWKDILGYLHAQGFQAAIHRDEATDSMPRLVNGVVRRIYVAFADDDRARPAGRSGDRTLWRM